MDRQPKNMASRQGYHWCKGTKIKILSFLCKKHLKNILVILSVSIYQIKTPIHLLITIFLQGTVLISCFCIRFQSDMDAEEEQEDDAGPLEQVSDWQKVRECGAVAHRSAEAKRKSSDSMLEEYLRKPTERRGEHCREMTSLCFFQVLHLQWSTRPQKGNPGLSLKCTCVMRQRSELCILITTNILLCSSTYLNVYVFHIWLF